jgi:hypothetical protein
MPKASASRLPKGSAETYNPADDPAPDVYSVTWAGAMVTVRHYPDRLTQKACCALKDRITPEDRAAAAGRDGITPAMVCLQRLRMPCGVDAVKGDPKWATRPASSGPKRPGTPRRAATR